MNLRYELLLNPLVIVCTVLLVVIPLLVQKINHYLHITASPPWKQQAEQEEVGSRTGIEDSST
jgi:Mg2+/Co2+ transporter CorB